MPANSHTISRACDSAALGARDAREKEGLRHRLEELLRKTAKVLDLEGWSQLK